ncbi:four-helix bundle copper-binding protein [Ottowia sp. GY511]|uniref:Four-helix bundle copper-binding protein n=1 Tax=Ottowia flava TaxID=2675430 RepID=A0ABW4KN75_9BURK|nr:four-helix bundle copper-binding protein [Ottowia sp. GY511]TXK29599.1 four-helix bundle copper-binding protein [Ottowia sp. GY511]
MEHTNAQMQACIDQCLKCYQVCQGMALTHCLKLGGQHTEPTHFRLMLNCAEICRTSAAIMLSGSPLHQRTCALCADVCEECADDCERVSDMQECVDACRACAQSCRAMAGAAA